MMHRKIKTVSYPEYKDTKYLIVDGEIYFNLAVEPGAVIAARFLRANAVGEQERGR
jgi:hypothetical protein